MGDRLWNADIAVALPFPGDTTPHRALRSTYFRMTKTLSSGHRVRYLSGGYQVQVTFYCSAIDRLIEALEAAQILGLFAGALCLQDFREIQEHFLEQEGERLLFEARWQRLEAEGLSPKEIIWWLKEERDPKE